MCPEKEWQSKGSPGYLGSKRDAWRAEQDARYGIGNWRLVHQFGALLVDFASACKIYEDAYCIFLCKNWPILHELTAIASNVYDDDVSNVNSGFDYLLQETSRTHIQDIAIRNVLMRQGLWFKGNRLIQIRQELGDHPLSILLSPGKVPFHRPDLILENQSEGKWWDKNSVESWYQRNRILQVKTC